MQQQVVSLLRCSELTPCRCSGQSGVIVIVWEPIKVETRSLKTKQTARRTVTGRPVVVRHRVTRRPPRRRTVTGRPVVGCRVTRRGPASRRGVPYPAPRLGLHEERNTRKIELIVFVHQVDTTSRCTPHFVNDNNKELSCIQSGGISANETA